MAVSTKTEYALRALLKIAEEPEAAVSAQTICDQQQLPKKYIEHLLSSLKNAGLIVSSAGLKGGYILAKSAAEITLYDIIKAVDDHRLELDCNMGSKYCQGEDCNLKPIFIEIGEKQRELFRSYSLAKIAEKIREED